MTQPINTGQGIRPVPLGLTQDLATFLFELRSAVIGLQAPQVPTQLYRTTSAKLPRPASNWPGCVVDVTDLNTLAKCDGTNWVRIDTGATL